LSGGTYPVRGLPDKENDFGIYVVDKWNNYSDTLFFTCTPWREDYLDKKLFVRKQVQGDVRWNFFGGAETMLWDDLVDTWSYASTNDPVEFPHLTTIDLGVEVKLSRIRVWQRPHESTTYQHGNPKRYRIYGRLDDPGTGNASNILDGWTLLRECQSFKPSGLPVGQVSAEDEEYAAAGEEYPFPRDIEVIRYLRLEMLEAWSSMKSTCFSEISLWGTIQ
jgi:hypothetical protein